jgi:hypothetical protein
MYDALKNYKPAPEGGMPEKKERKKPKLKESGLFYIKNNSKKTTKKK